MNFILLLQITNFCLAFEIPVDDLPVLSSIIEVHHTRFNKLYPGNLTSKFHFLIHIPTFIILSGPARQQFCMRFEAAYAYYHLYLLSVASKICLSPLLTGNKLCRPLCYPLCLSGTSPKIFLDYGSTIKHGKVYRLIDIYCLHIDSILSAH